MLYANDLRVNNIFIIHGVKETVDVVTGLRISANGDEALMAHEGWKKISELIPIWLNPNLLDIFEFYANDNFTFYEGREFSLKYVQNTESFYYEGRHIRYVHELQNLYYALCGSEAPLYTSGDPHAINLNDFLK